MAPVASPGCSGVGNDTEWIKTVRVDSALLKFWGKSMRLEACVLLPYGFHDHLDRQVPVACGAWSLFGEFQPRRTLRSDAAGAGLSGYDRVDQLYANYFYNNWTSADGLQGARALVITVNHPVPFFDDSYAVDSANVGPYGAAIMRELIPAVEARYRGIGEGWARGVLGGSTGGREAFAAQVLYPDDFNYAAIRLTDPIAFYVVYDGRPVRG